MNILQFIQAKDFTFIGAFFTLLIQHTKDNV